MIPVLPAILRTWAEITEVQETIAGATIVLRVAETVIETIIKVAIIAQETTATIAADNSLRIRIVVHRVKATRAADRTIRIGTGLLAKRTHLTASDSRS